MEPDCWKWRENWKFAEDDKTDSLDELNPFFTKITTFVKPSLTVANQFMLMVEPEIGLVF